MIDPDRSAFWAEMESRYADSAIHGALGLTLRVVGPGEVEVRFDGTAQAGNRARKVAGGAIASMIDSAVTQAIRTMLAADDAVATVDLTVSFVRPASLGRGLSTIGHVDKIGRTLGFGHASTTDPEGEIVATGMATISIRRGEEEKGGRASRVRPSSP